MSYPRLQRAVVERLVNDLRQGGYEPYFDKELTGGQNWWDALLGQVEDSEVFMPVVCGAYLDSTPCKLEAQHAIACRKLILPVQVEQVPAQLFPASIATAQWVSYDPMRQGTVLDIIRALNTLPPPTEPPLDRPVRPPAPISYMTELQDEIHGPAAIPRERQFVLIGELKSRLRTADRDAATLLLRTMASRSDLVYQAVMDINAVLESEGVHGNYTAHRQEQWTFAGSGAGPNNPPPQWTPEPSGSATHNQVATKSARTRPAAWILLGIAVLLLVLSLFTMDWSSVSDSAATFKTISSNVEHGAVSTVPFVYFKGLGYVLEALAVLLALVATATTRRSTVLTWLSIGVGIAAILACVVGTGLFVQDVNDALSGYQTVSLEPGFGVNLAALVLLVIAAVIPRRRV